MRRITKKIVFLLLTGFLFTCQDDPDISLQTTRLNKDTAWAQEWYRAHRPKEILLLSRGQGNSPIEVKPNWVQVTASSNKKQKVVEIGLYMKGAMLMTLDENKQKFEETGDERYISSHTRLVIKNRLKDKKTSGFLMTVMPSVEYLELTDFNPFEKIGYIERDKQFTGRIVYHSLNGEFMNGWEYKNGKITHSIKPSHGVDDPVVMMKSSGSYDCVLILVWGYTRICTDWYQYDFYGWPVYVGTTCSPWVWGVIDSSYFCTWTGGDGSGEDGGEDTGGSSGGGGGEHQGGGSGFNEGYFGGGIVSSSGDCTEKAVANSNAIQTVLTSQHMDYPLQSVSTNLDILRGYAVTKTNECVFTVAYGDGDFFSFINIFGEIITESGSSEQVAVSRSPNTHMWVHSHPQGQNPAPSPNDVVQLLFAAVDGSPNIRSNVIIASDNSEYIVHVDDPVKFMNYAMVGAIDLYEYTGADFRPNTAVAKEYEKVKEDLSRNGYTQNNAQAHALAHVLDYFDMGIKIYKRDSPSGDFKELKTIKCNNNKYQPQICQ